jgi:hypothetical protein
MKGRDLVPPHREREKGAYVNGCKETTATNQAGYFVSSHALHVILLPHARDEGESNTHKI